MVNVVTMDVARLPYILECLGNKICKPLKIVQITPALTYYSLES